MQSPPTGVPWTSSERAKINGTSVFALVASLSGFVCFVGIGGALGIVLGLVARAEIARTEGREGGRGLANGAIVLGIGNLALAVVALAIGITYLARPHGERAPLGAPHAHWTTPGAAPPRAAPIAKRHRHDERASRETETQTTVLGAITVVDLAGDFESELAKQHRAAETAGETAVLWVVVRNCKPCDGVSAALTSPLAQKALAKVRFVRADRDDFQIELERLGLPPDKIPGFALLDAHGHVRDFIHGGEWDADIAANIAPVLGKFVHNSYRRRRHAWQGGVRADDTPI